jgi:uncharacterized protein (TIGR02265 family)
MTNRKPNPLAAFTRVEHAPVPDDNKRSLVAFNVLIQSVDNRLTPAMRAEIEKEFAPYLGKHSYPALVGNTCMDRLCALALSDLPLAEARQVFGRYFLTRYRESLVGRVMLAMLPMMGMERILRKSPQDFATATNYGTRWVQELAPRHWEYHWEDEILYPEFIEGLFHSAGEIARVPNLRVSFTQPGPRDLVFDFQWD